MKDRLKFLWQAILATYVMAPLRPWPDRVLAYVIGPFILLFHTAFNTHMFRTYYRMYLIETNQLEKL